MKKISILILTIALCTILVGCKNKEENIINNNGQNVIQNNQENNANNESHDYNEGGVPTEQQKPNNNSQTPNQPIEDIEIIPVDIKDNGDTMVVSMFGLYDIIYKFDGEKIIESYSKYSFGSELTLNLFVEEYKDKPEYDLKVEGLTATIKNDESEYENVTKTQLINEYENLKLHYSE